MVWDLAISPLPIMATPSSGTGEVTCCRVIRNSRSWGSSGLAAVLSGLRTTRGPFYRPMDTTSVRRYRRRYVRDKQPSPQADLTRVGTRHSPTNGRCATHEHAADPGQGLGPDPARRRRLDVHLVRSACPRPRRVADLAGEPPGTCLRPPVGDRGGLRGRPEVVVRRPGECVRRAGPLSLPPA